MATHGGRNTPSRDNQGHLPTFVSGVFGIGQEPGQGDPACRRP